MNVCSDNVTSERLNRKLKSTMFYVMTVMFCGCKKLLKITLWNLFWIVSFLTLATIYWNYNENYSEVVNASENPLIIWWTDGFPGSAETKYCSNNIKCDVFTIGNQTKLHNVAAYLFYGSSINFDNLPLPRRPKDLIWGLYHEESPRNTEELLSENVLQLFNFSATYSRYSDVHFPLQYLNSFEDITDMTYFVKTKDKDELLNEFAPIMYLQSDCETSTERDFYVQELMKFIKIDSYGACLNNKHLPSKFKRDYLNNLNEELFLKFIARYKFVISIENGVCEDYITEKFWRAIKVGSVPIYFGSPSIRDWLPNNKSAVLLEDYPSPKVMSEHLYKLLKNNNLYEEYLEHKIMQKISNRKLVEEFRSNPTQIDTLKTTNKFECLICEKIHDKINGKSAVNVVTKKHYNCPKPISALTLKVNPNNNWVFSRDFAIEKANNIYNKIMNEH